MFASLISILGLSFLLGIRHATDADHLVAINTIVSSQKKGILDSALVGIWWGIGHSVTVTLVGIPIILFSFVIPQSLGVFLEFLVGLMLVILGLFNLKHRHPHPQKFRPLIMGFVHGLAGSTAIALLILSTIHNINLAIFYLFIFHIGVISGMMLVTLGIGASITIAKRKSANLNHYLVPISGILSLLFGLYIMYQTLGVNILPPPR